MLYSYINKVTMMSCMHELMIIIIYNNYTCTTVSPDVDTSDYTHSEGTYTQPVTVACTQLYTN